MSRIALLVPALLVIVAACSGDPEFHDMSGATAAGTAGTAGTGTAMSDGGAETGADGGSAAAGKTGSAGSSSGRGGSKTTGGSTAGGSSAAEAGAGAGGEVALGASGQGAGGDSSSPGACPDVFGAYSITSSEGECGTLNDDAAQAIQGTSVACYAHFVSDPPSGAQGVNGGAALDASGDFTGAMLYLDTVQRNPCSGTYSATAKTMTVKCGGGGDLCTVVLKRKS